MYHHTNIGNTHTIIFGRFTVTDDGTSLPLRTVNDGTDDCRGEEAVEFERRAAIAVLRQVDLIDRHELSFARYELGVTQSKLAEFLGVSEMTVSRWEAGRRTFGRPVQLAMLQLLEAVNRGELLQTPKHIEDLSDYHVRVAQVEMNI